MTSHTSISIQIDVPGAPNTVPIEINNRGQIVGFYENPEPASGMSVVNRPGKSARITGAHAVH